MSSTFVRPIVVVVIIFIAVNFVIASPGDGCDPITNPCPDAINTECKLNDVGDYTCQCHRGWITDTTNKRCLQLAEKPGDPCEPTLAKCTLVPNSNCVSLDSEPHSCICNTGFVPLPGKCLATPTMPGAECHPSAGGAEADCSSVPNTSCASSDGIHRCLCTGELVTDIAAGVCLVKPEKPGQPCHPTLTPCADVHLTTCVLNPISGTSACMCDASYVTDMAKGACLKIPTAPGDSCETSINPCSGVTSTECESDDSGPGATYYCKCVSPLVTDVVGRSCLTPPTQPGDSCHVLLTPCSSVAETECTLDTDILSKYYCKCVGEFVNHPAEPSCFPLPKSPGDECLPVQAPCNEIPSTECRTSQSSIVAPPAPPVYSCMCDGDLITDLPYSRCISKPTAPGHPCSPLLGPCAGISNTTCSDDGAGPYCKCAAEYATDVDGARCLLHPTRPGQLCVPGLTDCSRVVLPEPGPEVACAPADDGRYDYCKCQGDADAEYEYVTDEVGGTCLKIPQWPGDPCDPILTPCTAVNNTECAPTPVGDGSYYCRCNAGYNNTSGDDGAGACLKLPLRPGDECDLEAAPCRIEDADVTCTDDGGGGGFYCKCNGDLITEHGKCFGKPEFPGDACSPTQAPCDSPYLTNRTHCVESDGDADAGFYCMCHPDTYFTDFLDRACVRLPTKPNDRCDANHTTTTCASVPNSECRPAAENGPHTCACNADYFPTTARCVALPTKPLDPCSVQTHCDSIPYTKCKGDGDGDGDKLKVCACLPNTDLSLDGSSCLRKSEFVDQVCESDASCSNVQNTECVEGDDGLRRCRCLTDYFPAAENKSCLAKVNYLGQPCLEDAQCALGIGVESVCEDVCVCTKDFVGNTNRNKCLKKSVYTGPCEEDVQCTSVIGPNAECDAENLCACKPLMGFLNNGCHRSIPLSSHCQTDEECILGTSSYAACNSSSSLCSCVSDAISWDNYCYGDLSFGSPCASDIECSVSIIWGVCDRRDKTCTCEVGKVPASDKICKSSANNRIHQKSLAYLAIALTIYTLSRFNTY